MNKKAVIISAVAVLILLGGGGYFVLSSNNKPVGQNQNSAQLPLEEEEQEAIEISPDDIGLVLSLRPDKRAIKFTIENASDIKAVDYEISYTKEVGGEEVSDGLIGEALTEGGKVEINYRELGTCSSGTCRYDKVTSPVKVTLKIVKTDNKIYKSEKSIEL